jgi:DNA polymerase
VPFHGSVPAFIAVLGEGPGKEEDAAGRPFVGPAGRLLRQHLTGVGLDPESLTWMKATWCWAGVGTNPTSAQVAACEPNRRSQLELLNPSYLLVFGATALGSIRPGLPIRRSRGKAFLHGSAVTWAVYHPSAILRNHLMEQPFREDLEAFVDLVDVGRDRWWEFVSERCYECPDVVDRYDETGVGKCRRHWAPRTSSVSGESYS